MSDPIQAVAQHLRRARRILFITGAGLSADSGLPTYRGIGGLYDGKQTEDDMPIEVAISGEVMSRRPEISWKYLLQIERGCRAAGPNLGHEIIAKIEQAKPETWVLTQNIDGFHRAAGSRNLIEIHGRFSELYCMSCQYREDNVPNYAHIHAIPPRCPQCGGVIRPAVVLFGEMLPQAAVAQLMEQLGQGFDLVFSIGTTSVFPYISRPVVLASQAGTPTVEINPGHTEVSNIVDYKFSRRAIEVLPALWQRMNA
jgi:NAD-dependent deacetylase